MVQWIKKADESSNREEIKEFWNPTEIGQEFTGVLEIIVPNKGLNKNNNLYLFRNDNGELIGLMGTKQLNETLPSLIGKKVILVYRGKIKTKKGFQFKIFDIGIDENYQEVEFINDVGF